MRLPLMYEKDGDDRQQKKEGNEDKTKTIRTC
jgi:hypothetical protein